MRVGFASIYSWRPHVQQMVYLAELAAAGGAEVRFLTCDSNLPTCYTRELRPQRSRALECAGCQLAGVRSYRGKGVTSIGALRHGEPDAALVARGWGASSASTIGRFESDEDYASPEFLALKQRLDEPAAIGYEAARVWIARERLDAVVAFNGRMDVTRGIAEAVRDAGLRYVSMERTWFGDGLQLLPDENCLGLANVHRLVAEWADKPLTLAQARHAAATVAARFTRSNSKEWRAYNVSAAAKPWPAGGRYRVLLVPGSRNEVWGAPDYASGWGTRLEAYDGLIAHLGLAPEDLVLRAHPNWAGRIGSRTGAAPERYYRDWAAARGVLFIPSDDDTSTLGLIEQADAIVVAGGSAALEAGLLGKRVIGLSSSSYTTAGLEERAYAAAELSDIRQMSWDVPPEHRQQVARQTLRFLYSVARRIPQFCEHVRCLSPTKYEYVCGADARRLIDLIDTGHLIADDHNCAGDASQEDVVLELVADRRWSDLLDTTRAEQTPSRYFVSRRLPFRPVDALRARLPVGDL